MEDAAGGTTEMRWLWDGHSSLHLLQSNAESRSRGLLLWITAPAYVVVHVLWVTAPAYALTHAHV